MSNTEIWLSGPIEGIHPLLQPVAHALLQVRHDITQICSNLDEKILWQHFGDAAPAGFHLAHISGATDRLFTYARGEQLSEQQIAQMKAEKSVAESRPDKHQLLSALNQVFDAAMNQLRNTSLEQLSVPREVGRAKLPSTVIGLLFHAAEHAQRHCGQITTTVKVLSQSS